MGNKQSCCVYPGGRSSGRTGNTNKGSSGGPLVAPGPLCLPPSTNWNARPRLLPHPPKCLQTFNTLSSYPHICSHSTAAGVPPPPSVTHSAFDQYFESSTEPISLTYPRTRPPSGATYYRTVSGPAGSTMLVQGGHARPYLPLSDFVPPYKNSRYSIPVPSHCSENVSSRHPSDSNADAASVSAVDIETQQCQKLLLEAEEYQKMHGRHAALVSDYPCYSSSRPLMNVSDTTEQSTDVDDSCSGCYAKAGVQSFEGGGLRAGNRRASGSDTRKRHTTNLNSFYYVPDPSYSFDREDYSWGDPNLHPGSSRYRHSIHVDCCRPQESHLHRPCHHSGQTSTLHHANSFSHHQAIPRGRNSLLKYSEDNLSPSCHTGRQRFSSGEDGGNPSCVPCHEVPYKHYNRSYSQPASANNLPDFLLTKVSNLIPVPLRSSSNTKQNTNKNCNSWYLSTDSDISNLSSSVHSTLSRNTHQHSGRQNLNDGNVASMNDHFSRAPSNCSVVKSSKSDVSTNHQSAYNYPTSLQTSSHVPVPPVRRLSFIPPIPILPDLIDKIQPPSRHHMPLRDSFSGVLSVKGPQAPIRSHGSKSKQLKTVTKPHTSSSSSASYFSVHPDPSHHDPAVVVSSSSVSQASLTSSFRYPPPPSSSLCSPTFPPPPPSHSHPTLVAVSTSTGPHHHQRDHRPWAAQTSGGGNVVDGRNGSSGGGGDQRGGSAAGACGSSLADTASSAGEDPTTTNIQHISEREHDDLDQDPSLHPTAGPMFLSKARNAQQNGIVRRRSRNELDNARTLKKSSSCSTIYLDDSTVSQPNLKNTIKCVALAIYYHIRNTASNRTLDIFDEKLHPLSKDGVHPDYDKNLPEHRHIYKFVRTLFNAAQLTAECAIITLVYLERLLTYAELDMTAGGWKRIVLGAIILASKVWDDQAVWNVDYCQILRDMSVDDMNELERQYLVMIQFNINVPASVYAKYYFSLRTLAEENDLSFPAEPLSKERAHKLEAMSRDCEDRYAAMLQDAATLGKKWSSLDNVNANHRRSVAILS